MLKDRLPSFIRLLVLACLLVFAPGLYGAAFLAIIGVLAIFFSANELGAMLNKIQIPNAPLIAATLAALTFLLFIYLRLFDITNISVYMILGLFLVIIILPWQLILRSSCSKNVVHGIIGTLGILFLLLPLLTIVPLYFMGTESQPITELKLFGTGISLKIAIICPLIVYLILVTKIGGDTCAYCIGSLSNIISKGKNHRISPIISPKKSWEGAIGAMVCSMFISYVFAPYLLPASLQGSFMSLSLGFILFWGGFFGDLAESALKRAAEVKDSGNFLPGTGGVLDVLDSLVFNAPILLFAVLIAALN